jgi:hypothetical protein
MNSRRWKHYLLEGMFGTSYSFSRYFNHNRGSVDWIVWREGEMKETIDTFDLLCAVRKYSTSPGKTSSF